MNFSLFKDSWVMPKSVHDLLAKYVGRTGLEERERKGLANCSFVSHVDYLESEILGALRGKNQVRRS